MIEEWAWFEQSGMIQFNTTINATLINDGLNTDTCLNNGEWTWTYNQGVILGGLVSLFEATGNSSLLDVAITIADSVLATQTYEDGVLREICETNGKDCGPDGSQFKGIFVRYLAVLATALTPSHARFNTYLQFLRTNANAVWTIDQNAEGVFGLVWNEAPNIVNGITHTSGVDALVAYATVEALSWRALKSQTPKEREAGLVTESDAATEMSRVTYEHAPSPRVGPCPGLNLSSCACFQLLYDQASLVSNMTDMVARNWWITLMYQDISHSFQEMMQLSPSSPQPGGGFLPGNRRVAHDCNLGIANRRIWHPPADLA